LLFKLGAGLEKDDDDEEEDEEEVDGLAEFGCSGGTAAVQ